MSLLSDFVSVDWEAFGKKLVDLVTKEGAVGIDAVKQAVIAIKAVSNKDFTALWLAVNKEIVDVQELESVIKSTFNLS